MPGSALFVLTNTVCFYIMCCASGLWLMAYGPFVRLFVSVRVKTDSSSLHYRWEQGGTMSAQPNPHNCGHRNDAPSVAVHLFQHREHLSLQDLPACSAFS